jgi:hypothetical protein
MLVSCFCFDDASHSIIAASLALVSAAVSCHHGANQENREEICSFDNEHTETTESAETEAHGVSGHCVSPFAYLLKLRRYDLENTFEVVIGKQSKHFTIHTNVFTHRSGVLATLHRSEYNPQNLPVDREGEDPELFQAYLNCVYFGPETLEQWADACMAESEAEPEGKTRDEEQAVADLVFEKLIRLYLLAERLVDLRTANMALGEIIRSSMLLRVIPMQVPTSLAYASTAKDSPLRTLLRDYWVYESGSTDTDRERLRTAGFPSEFSQDIAIEMLRIVSESEDYDPFDKTVKEIYSDNKCHYHQHDELHPSCIPVETGTYDSAPLLRVNT